MINKQFIIVNDVRLAYFDFGDPKATPLLALHGHFGRGSMFAGLARVLEGRWRVVAPDQRGHGWSDAPSDYSRQAYVTDAATLVQLLNLAPVVVLGHSLGGINAYQLAARHPELVRALIIEDIGALEKDDFSFLNDWPERFPTVRAVRDFLAIKGFSGDTFLESLVEYPDGWGFRFRYDYMKESQRLLNGDWWTDWLASNCPALLLHGHKSWVMTTEHAKEMASRRPNTHLVEFPNCGHTIHNEDPVGFYKAVEEFLNML